MSTPEQSKGTDPLARLAGVVGKMDRRYGNCVYLPVPVTEALIDVARMARAVVDDDSPCAKGALEDQLDATDAAINEALPGSGGDE